MSTLQQKPNRAFQQSLEDIAVHQFRKTGHVRRRQDQHIAKLPIPRPLVSPGLLVARLFQTGISYA